MRMASDEQIASTWFATLKHVIRQSAELTSGYRERSEEGRRDDCERKKGKRKHETKQRKHILAVDSLADAFFKDSLK